MEGNILIMAKEIERKFLVKDKSILTSLEGFLYKQGYLNTNPERTVRVRIIGTKGYITIKGINSGAVRTEYEYEIPYADADEMLNDLCKKPIITKLRYQLEFEGLIWEVDEFKGDNEGLVIAEVELPYESMRVNKPIWVGSEVTGDNKYYNSNLVSNPYKNWTQIL